MGARTEACVLEAGARLATAADLKALLRAYERRFIEAALAAHAGNQRRAALALGLRPTTLHER